MRPPADAETLTPVATALERLLSQLGPTTTERVPLHEAAGRVLAVPVVATWGLPGLDNSAMDGYAVLARDCRAPATVLRVVGEARAGSAPGELTPGCAMAISTGAPIPRGADAVVPVEDTRPGAGTVVVLVTVEPGAFVRRAGGDISPGMVMVPRGRRLRSIEVAACAAVGATTVSVHARPRVAILGGGAELVPVGVAPALHQVVDSNSPMIAAAVVEAGAQPVMLGLMRDDRASVRQHLDEAAGCDLVITTAGVSVGAHDHLRSVVEELGRVLVWRVAMRPGKPVLLGQVRGTCVVGLPGNPVSSAVTFEVFGRSAILALQGAAEPARRRLAVRMGEDVATPAELETYLRVRLQQGDDGLPVARLSGDQGSAMLRSLGDADALAIIPAGTADVLEGTVVGAIELG